MSLVAFIAAAFFGLLWALAADTVTRPEAWAVTLIALGLALDHLPDWSRRA